MPSIGDPRLNRLVKLRFGNDIGRAESGPHQLQRGVRRARLRGAPPALNIVKHYQRFCLACGRVRRLVH
jgi:hypothetical protein